MKRVNELRRPQERWSRLTAKVRETTQGWSSFPTDRVRRLRSRTTLLCLARGPTVLWRSNWAVVTGPYGARWTVVFRTYRDLRWPSPAVGAFCAGP